VASRIVGSALSRKGIPENHPNRNVIEVRNSKVTGDSYESWSG
jgi:hypothetical protein